MHDGIQYDPIQGQGHRCLDLANCDFHNTVRPPSSICI